MGITFFLQYTEVRFASLLSGGFTTMAIINPPERKLAKRTSVQCGVQDCCHWMNDLLKGEVSSVVRLNNFVTEEN